MLLWIIGKAFNCTFRFMTRDAEQEHTNSITKIKQSLIILFFR